MLEHTHSTTLQWQALLPPLWPTSPSLPPPIVGVQFKNAKSGKVFKMSYPCAMLNVMVAEHNTNDQFAVRGSGQLGAGGMS